MPISPYTFRTSFPVYAAAFAVCMLAAGVAYGQNTTPGTAAASSAIAPISAAPVPVSTDATTITVHGTVKSGNVPLPGATIIAVDSSGKKYSAASNENGVFQMTLPVAVYNIRASLAAFASDTQTVQLTAGQSVPDMVFPLQLASRAEATQAAASRAAVQRGMQNLSLLNSSPDAAPAAGAAADTTDTSATLLSLTRSSGMAFRMMSGAIWARR